MSDDKKSSEKKPKNAMVCALYKHIEEILKLGQDFRDSFYFEKD